jgi:AcrR family transcriptional regulator
MSRASNANETKWDRRYKDALDAAAEAFAERGYLGSSTKDIADKLGIQQGSLYYYLPSKEQALAAICELGVQKFVARLGEILDSNAPSSEKLRAAIANHLMPLTMKPEGDYVRVFVHHRHQLPSGPRQAVAALARRYHNLIERLFAEAVRCGDFRSDLNPTLAAHAMLGLCNSVTGARTPPAGASIEAIIEEYADILTRGTNVDRSKKTNNKGQPASRR